jgi:myo-inositol-1(or 4)-monophosphatase
VVNRSSRDPDASDHPLAIAVRAARAAGGLLRERVGGPLRIAEKARRNDLVTDADRASEALIVRILRAATPSAAILGEEGGATAGTSDERWIVDPLDGTTNYAHGYPFWCVSIAYERAGVVVAAAIEAPMFGETYTATLGGGAACNDVPLRVTDPVALGDAFVCTGFKPDDYDRNGTAFAAASRVVQGVRRDGSAALDLAFTARGRFDAFWEYDLAPWDVAAGELMVREAGGVTTTLDGSAHAVTSASILCAGPALHGPLRALLSTQRSRNT